MTRTASLALSTIAALAITAGFSATSMAAVHSAPDDNGGTILTRLNNPSAPDDNGGTILTRLTNPSAPDDNGGTILTRLNNPSAPDDNGGTILTR